MGESLTLHNVAGWLPLYAVQPDLPFNKPLTLVVGGLPPTRRCNKLVHVIDSPRDIFHDASRAVLLTIRVAGFTLNPGAFSFEKRVLEGSPVS